MTTTITYVIVYLIILAGITYVASKKQSQGEYLNSAKNLSASEQTWTTFASIISGYNFVVAVTFSYLYGLWFLFIYIGAALSFITFYFIYKKYLHPLQKEHNLLSVGDYFEVRYGVGTRHLVNLTLLVALLLFLTLQIFVNTGLLNVLLGISKLYATLLTAGIVGLYLWFGGFKVSVRTDIFQGILMLPIFLTVLYFPNNLSLENVHQVLDTSKILPTIGFVFLQYFVLLGQPEGFQRVFASRDVESLKKGLTMSFILAFGLALCMVYLGINFKLAGGDVDVGSLFTNVVLPALPVWLSSLLAVSLMAAFMGNIDSISFAFGSLVAKYFAKKDEESVNTNIRYFTTLGLLFASICSLYLSDFFASLFALVSVLCVMGSAFVFSIYLNWDKVVTNLYLVVGIVTFIAGVFFKFITDNPGTSLIPIGVGLVCVYLYKFLLNK